MISDNQNPVTAIDQLTKKSVRAFWMDGLWDLVVSGMFIIIGLWGMFYVQFAAFPSWTWPFFESASRSAVWLGLLVLVTILVLYIGTMWKVVGVIKRRLLSPYTGYAEHRFFFPVDPKVYAWYAIIYIAGLGILYGLFAWLTGGMHVMSVPFIISPAAILIGIGWFYKVQRYIWIAVIGFTSAVLLEFFATTQASYQAGPVNFLDILPTWGSPALPCLVWAALFLISGVLGLSGIWRRAGE
jgi:hypothetical protein